MVFLYRELQRGFSLRDVMVINIITETFILAHFKRNLPQQEREWRNETRAPSSLLIYAAPTKPQFPSGCHSVTQFVCCPLECARDERGSAHVQVLLLYQTTPAPTHLCVYVCVCLNS